MNNYESFVTDIVKDFTDDKFTLLLRQSIVFGQREKLMNILIHNYVVVFDNTYFHYMIQMVLNKNIKKPNQYEVSILCDKLLEKLDDETKLYRLEKILELN